MQQSDIGLRECLTSAHTEHAIFPFVILKTHTHTRTYEDTRTHAMFFAPSALWPVLVLIHISSMPSEKLLLSQLSGRFYNAVARVSVYIHTQAQLHALCISGVCLCLCSVCMLVSISVPSAHSVNVRKKKKQQAADRHENRMAIRQILECKTLSHIDCALSKLNTRAKQQAT